MSIRGRYYDGRTSQSHDLQIELDDDGLIHSIPALFAPIKLKAVKISSRIGNTPRVFTLPSGAVFETSNNEDVDLWLRQAGRSNWAHLLESRVSYALGALFITVALFVLGAIWGIPWISKTLAHTLPAQVSVKLGEGALNSMDRFFFDSSELSQGRQRELSLLFQELLPDDNDEFDYVLNFRKGGFIGPNAFALPNGHVVMTDELVGLAENDEEIASVLLHEIGHVVHRHSLQQAINHSGLAVLTLAITGDVNAAGAIIVALPGILFQSSYAREMEWEADGYSLEKMQQMQMNPEHFANFMERLETYIPPFPEDDDTENEEQADNVALAAGTEGVSEPGDITQEQTKEESTAGACASRQDEGIDEEPGWFNYLSTHPPTAERIARFRQTAIAE